MQVLRSANARRGLLRSALVPLGPFHCYGAYVTLSPLSFARAVVATSTAGCVWSNARPEWTAWASTLRFQTRMRFGRIFTG